MMKKIVILTGAGMSADSGLKTFRDADGLWEGHDVMSVASPVGFARDPELVFEFYNQRRRQLLQAQPNAAHMALARLEACYDTHIITQNVDDLHERGGSTNVLHLHGELLKARSTGPGAEVYDWRNNLAPGDKCPEGYQLRPHIVWFGEEVPLLGKAAEITMTADLLIIVGTSLQVYPAAGLVHYAPRDIPVFFVDPNPSLENTIHQNLKVIAKKAANGIPPLVQDLIAKAENV